MKALYSIALVLYMTGVSVIATVTHELGVIFGVMVYALGIILNIFAVSHLIARGIKTKIWPRTFGFMLFAPLLISLAVGLIWIK